MKYTLLLLLLTVPNSAIGDDWACRNPIEISCSVDNCEVRTDDTFTPMDIHLSDSGEMSVCAYSGCWEGMGRMIKSDEFTIFIGRDLQFSTVTPAQRSGKNIIVVIDEIDSIATLKAGSYVHPLLCHKSDSD